LGSPISQPESIGRDSPRPNNWSFKILDHQKADFATELFSACAG